MSSTPQFTTGQLSAARAQAWHQTGEPLLTLEAVREWINTTGLLLFAPRPQHIAAPAPSLVEATLGEAAEAVSIAQTGTARSLVARLVSEGNALPLNLLGGPGEMPDFIVSAQMFSFIFTMRGDKLWKQPPSTSGSVKVSPLSLAVYELLTERGALTAAELASELGREVTEAAILRSLNELWAQLRVIPLLQQGEAATMWELTSRRFTKTIKAGINAGQPTALSALVSLYLAQALLATEEEVAAFLSPLAPRSRIREVVHGLTAARQLEPIVLEGKALLHIPGTLPEFPAAEVEADAEVGDETAKAEVPAQEEGRIKRFTRAAGESADRSDFKGKPLRSFAGSRGASSRDRAPRTGGPSRFGAKPERTERERRPFRRTEEGAGETPGFTRPWDEDRKPRRESSEGGEERAPAPRRFDRAARPAASGFRKPGGFGDKPRFSRDDRGGERKPFKRREDGAEGGDAPRPRRSFGSSDSEGFRPKPRFGGNGERKPFTRREDGDSAPRPRRTSGEGSGDRPRFNRESDAERRPFTRRPEGSDSPRPRRSFAGGEGEKPRINREDRGERRPYKPRVEGGSEARPRRSFGGDAEGGKPRFSREGGGARKPGSSGAKRPFVRRDGESSGRPSRPSFGAKRSFGDRAERGDRPAGGDRPARPSGVRGERPAGAARGKFGPKPGGRSFGSRPGGKVPFGGKPGSGKRPAGGTRPTPRKPRPETEE